VCKVAFIAWWMEVVVQHTGKWRQSGRESPVSHEVGRTSTMTRFRCTSSSREEGKRRGRGSLGEEACKQQYPKKKGRGRGRRDGGFGTGT
jgi:hypothetical protein